jgi:hypothetical protein
MASVYPITSAVNAPLTAPLVVPPQSSAQAAVASAQAAAAGQGAQTAQTAAATTTTTQPFDLVFDSLALDSAFDETILTSTAVQGTGAYSVFMGELFAALAAQQTEAARANAATTPAAAATQATPAADAPATIAAAATAEFASNASSLTPNSALESSVQALAGQVQAANAATDRAATPAADTLSPLQQSFEQFVASAGATAGADSLPSFLQALAVNLHTVPSPLGNLVDSVT